jgi:CheY-like chemotaxis protein
MSIPSPWESFDNVLVSITDISAVKQAQRKLLEANRQKDEFMAMLGHELRNPLASTRVVTEIMAELRGADERLHRLHAILDRQTDHMSRLLDGLLDVSRIARGKIAIEREPVDLAETVRQVVADHGLAESGQFDLRLVLPDAAILVTGDRVRLTQIIDNLLSNAVKFTPAGGTIEIAASVDHGKARLRVRDSGAGIDPDLLPHIFEPFRQGRQSLDRTQGGLGLGLALVRGLAELHGGSVRVHSDGVGRGSEFTVELPLAQPQPPRSPEPAATGARRHILIVEDNLDLAEMMGDLLRMSGHTVTVVADARQGLDAVRSTRTDVVLCDLGLPNGLSGFDFAREVRNSPELDSVLLVAVTGYGAPEDIEATKMAGFDVHLTKPVTRQTLAALLRVEATARRKQHVPGHAGAS